MVDRPILFSAPMVRALLAGDKTQTRRVLNPQPAKWEARVIDIREPAFDDEYQQWGQWETVWNRCAAMWEPQDEIFRPLPLRFAVGDRLWVKETWRVDSAYNHLKPSLIHDHADVSYVADGVPRRHGKTRVSIFMPRWASRITLLVTDVRVERLQSCIERDAIAEGVSVNHWMGDTTYSVPNYSGSPTALAAYRFLWDTINGAGAWEANPWVVALTFEVERRNIDAVQS